MPQPASEEKGTLQQPKAIHYLLEDINSLSGPIYFQTLNPIALQKEIHRQPVQARLSLRPSYLACLQDVPARHLFRFGNIIIIIVTKRVVVHWMAGDQCCSEFQSDWGPK